MRIIGLVVTAITCVVILLVVKQAKKTTNKKNYNELKNPEKIESNNNLNLNKKEITKEDFNEHCDDQFEIPDIPEDITTPFDNDVGVTMPFQKGYIQKKPVLIKMSNNEKVCIDSNKFLIGRLSSKVNYVINNKSITKVHARIEYKNKHYYVIDMGSLNHTFINDEQLESNKEYEIKSKDKIKFADTEFEFQLI